MRFVNMIHTHLSPLLLDNISFHCKRLVFIPDNRLNLIPYATLGNSTGMASKSVLDYPLLANFTISQSPSIWALFSKWMRTSNNISESSDTSIQQERNSLALIIGNPENNLPAAEEESSLVAQSLEGNTELSVLKLTQHLATRDIVLDSLCSSTVVHIAAHGNLDADENRIRAGAVRLADGTLFANDIEVFLFNDAGLVTSAPVYSCFNFLVFIVYCTVDLNYGSTTNLPNPGKLRQCPKAVRYKNLCV